MTKDSSSLIIVLKSCFIAVMGFSFVGAVGVAKKARIVRSYSRVTKLFVARCAGGLWEGVRAVALAAEGAAASEGAMVEGGGSVIDPRRLA